MLSGERVVLRPLTDDDVEPLWRGKLDPVTWARTSDGPLLPTPLATTRAAFAEPRAAGDALFAVDAGGVLVGQALLFGVDHLSRSAELGLWLLEEHRGRGLGRDALRVLAAYAFRSRNLRRLSLRTLASNAPALAVYRALGFVEEGRQREAAWVEGAYDDLVLMSLLRSDPRS